MQDEDESFRSVGPSQMLDPAQSPLAPVLLETQYTQASGLTLVPPIISSHERKGNDPPAIAADSLNHDS